MAVLALPAPSEGQELPPGLVVPELARLGLSELRVEKQAHPILEGLLDPEDRYFLVVRLGTLTRTQFDRIRQLYGNHATVDYLPGKEYRLKDFLPPPVQAVLNKTFKPIRYDLSFMKSGSFERKIRKLRKSSPDGEDIRMIDGLLWSGLSTETNCWNATVETLNAINGGTSTYRIFTPARWDIDEELKTASFGKAVASEQQLKPWDVLLISVKSPYTGREILQHTALVINRHLVFEKVDSTANHPYRLSLLEDVLQKYRRTLADTFRMEFRRYAGGHLLYRQFGQHDGPYPELTARAIGGIRPEIDPSRLSYGCDSGREDRCTYSFQVVEYLNVVTGEGGGELRGWSSLLERFQSLE